MEQHSNKQEGSQVLEPPYPGQQEDGDEDDHHEDTIIVPSPPKEADDLKSLGGERVRSDKV